MHGAFYHLQGIKPPLQSLLEMTQAVWSKNCFYKIAALRFFFMYNTLNQ